MNNIVEGIIGGTITVNNPEAFTSLLSQYPNNPDLYFLYANLIKKCQSQKAASVYGKVAQISIESGNLIKGIISQANKWRLLRPNKEEIDNFFSKLNIFENHSHDFFRFFTSLSRSEKIDLMCKLDLVVIPPKTTIKKPGEIENFIYFVISGEAKESFYQLLDRQTKRNNTSCRIVGQYDHFGEPYPYTEQNKSQSFIESITLMQLAKLSKDSLRRLCQKYPRIEQGMIKLCGIRSDTTVPATNIKLRKSNRYPIKVKMSVKVLKSLNHDLEFNLPGFSKDLSVTGVGFIPNESSKELKESLAPIIEKNEKIMVNTCFNCDNISVSINGELVRLQEIIESGRKTIVLGIQFEKMPPNMQGFLFSAAKVFSIR